jgi:hypothetical protein
VTTKAGFGVFGIVFWILKLFVFHDSKDNNKMEDASYLLAPMQEQRVENMAGDVVIERLFEFLCKDSVVFVQH